MITHVLLYVSLMFSDHIAVFFKAKKATAKMSSRDELSQGIVAYGRGEGADNGARKEYANPDFWEKRFEGTEGLLTVEIN